MSVFQKCKKTEHRTVAYTLAAPASRLGSGVDTPNYLPQILDTRTKHLLLDTVMMLDLPGQSALLYKDVLEINGGPMSQVLNVSLNHDLLRLVGRIVATMHKVISPSTLKEAQLRVSSYCYCWTDFKSHVNSSISRRVFGEDYTCVPSKHLRSMSLIETLAVASLACWVKQHRTVGAVQEGGSETLVTKRKIEQIANELSVDLFGWIPIILNRDANTAQKLVGYRKAQVAYNWVKDNRPTVSRCSTETFLDKQQQQVFSQLLGMIIRAYKVVDKLDIPAEELPAVVENFLRYTTECWLEELADIVKPASRLKKKESLKAEEANMIQSTAELGDAACISEVKTSYEQNAPVVLPLGSMLSLNEQIVKEVGSLSPSTLLALAHDAEKVKRTVLSVVDAQTDPVVKEVMSKMAALFLKDL